MFLIRPIALKLSRNINGIISYFAHKFWSNSYWNLISTQDLYFITQSNIKNFDLKATYTSGVIHWKHFYQFSVLRRKKSNKFLFFEKWNIFCISVNPISDFKTGKPWTEFFKISSINVWALQNLTCFHYSISRNIYIYIYISISLSLSLYIYIYKPVVCKS